MKLLHGTTRRRGAAILRGGPDPAFREGPGDGAAGAFCPCRVDGPFPPGRPEEYAERKSALFPEEGGPVIIEVDVPLEIVEQRVWPELFPLIQGVVEFDVGSGPEALIAAWPDLPKRLRSIGES